MNYYDLESKASVTSIMQLLLLKFVSHLVGVGLKDIEDGREGTFSSK